ncbi:MAG: PQQ-binding-like beta-propeller repeat protein [Verrucomicrobiota bacterium]
MKTPTPRCPLLFLALLSVWGGFLLSAAADWPQWRGPDQNGHSPDSGLLSEWPEKGPELLWTFENAGEGYSAPVIVGDSLYTLGSRQGQAELLCLDLTTGQEKWSTVIGPDPKSGYKTGWGSGTRGSPTVKGGLAFALSANGMLLCADAETGAKKWSVHLLDDLNGVIPKWGYAESPLVDGNQVVVTPGGAEGAIAAFDKTDGSLLWRSTGLEDGAQYSSLVITEAHNQRQYVQLFMNTLAGVDPSNGDLLWSALWRPGRVAVIPTPIAQEEKVYISAGYGAGCLKLDISGPEPTKLWDNKVMKNHHGGVILHDGYLYGFSDGLGLTCQSWETGEEVWSQEKGGLKKGSLTYADGHFYCLEQAKGMVVLVEATPEAYGEKGRFFLPELSSSRDTHKGQVWSHPVVVDGKLFLRDQELLFCYQVGS